MSSNTVQLTEKIRDRLCERALAGSPQWLAPILPAAETTALALMVGTMTGKLPAEDRTAIVRAIIAEQNADGSWSRTRNGNGDASVTLEIVQALSMGTEGEAQAALASAVDWLEANRGLHPLRRDTVTLLAALTKTTPTRFRLLVLSAARWLSRGRNSEDSGLWQTPSKEASLSILSRDRIHARKFRRALLELQRHDGSWDGSVRTTAFAMIALRHAGLPSDDSAFERGWRFLRGLQLWNHDGLMQNPCDLSILFHATAIRTLLTTGVEPEAMTASILTLLHQTGENGIWSPGASLPPDHLTSALALDAFNLAGDVPVETSWVRRRAVFHFLQSQRFDGGWSLDAYGANPISRLFSRQTRFSCSSSVEVTAVVLQTLVYSKVAEAAEVKRLIRAARFLTRRQHRDGLWEGQISSSEILPTALAIDALNSLEEDRYANSVLHGALALVRRQKKDGGWSDLDVGGSSVHHTALALRALQAVPAVPTECLERARQFLKTSVDASELMWSRSASAMAFPCGMGPMIIPELTSLLALEALVPIGIPTRPRARVRWHSRSISDRGR